MCILILIIAAATYDIYSVCDKACLGKNDQFHYSDVIMGAMVSKITSLNIV